MPSPNQIDPNQLRERGLMETDDQYAARMREIDRREDFFARLITPTTAALESLNTTSGGGDG